MTNLEALAVKVGYPLRDNAFRLALEERGVVADDTFTPNAQAFELAYADSLVRVLTAPGSISEGGFSVSVGDRKYLEEVANQVYAKYQVASPLRAMKPKATFRQPW